MPKQTRYFEGLYARYNKRALVSPDPLQFLYAFPDVRERELAALLCACFAYGNVKQILKNLEGIFARMDAPRAFILNTPPAEIRRRFAGFKYRFTTARELCALLEALKNVLKKYGTLEDCFLAGYRETDGTVLPALRAFARELRSKEPAASLVPDPDKTSALKRLNLFLRWMVRQDEVDPGGWTRVSPAKLLVPVDVHMHRLARGLGLTKRRAADIKTAEEITLSLARFCPQDPVKYDFCLTRFGIREDMDYADLALPPKPRSKKL